MKISEEMLKKAKELGLEVDEDTEETDLLKLIKEKEDEVTKKKDKDKDKDADYWKEEANKAFEARDLAKKERRDVQKRLKDIEDELSSAPDKSSVETMQKQLDSLTKYKEAIEKEREERDLKDKTELERKDIEFNKKLETLRKEMEEGLNEHKKELVASKETLEQKETQIRSLRKSNLSSEVFQHASKFGAYNPTQIVKLLSDRFEWDEDLSKFVNYIKNDKGKLVDELNVEETVKSFLEDDENDNLVKSKVKIDGLHRKDSDAVIKDKDKDKDKKDGLVQSMKTADGKYDPTHPAIIKSAEESRLSIEDYIEVREMRDSKMSKVREISK